MAYETVTCVEVSGERDAGWGPGLGRVRNPDRRRVSTADVGLSSGGFSARVHWNALCLPTALVGIGGHHTAVFTAPHIYVVGSGAVGQHGSSAPVGADDI
ncbi:MAG: hypothetical protein ABGY41_12640 [Candidatus Poribacteria bacterium]